MKGIKLQSGYTIFEAIAFLAIMTLVGVSVFSLVNKMIGRYRISRVVTQVSDLQKAVDARFAASADFSSLNNELVKTERLGPRDILWNGNRMFHAYGGEVFVRGFNADRYELEFDDLPYNLCVELASQDWSYNQYSSLLWMEVNGQKLEWVDSSRDEYNMPISITTAGSICNTGQNNDIVWAFQ